LKWVVAQNTLKIVLPVFNNSIQRSVPFLFKNKDETQLTIEFQGAAILVQEGNAE